MKIRITSTTNLIAFLRKLKTVDKSVLLELKETKLFSKVHTPDKSVMKYASIDLPSIFDPIEDWSIEGSDRVKIGIMDVGKLIDCFRHFRPEEDIFLDLNVQDVDGEPTVIEIKVVSASLTIRIKCADLSLLSYVKDDILKVVHGKEGYESKFNIYNSDLTSIDSLCKLETNSQELLNFEIDSEKVISAGDSFRYKLNIGKSDIEIESGEVMKASIYKSQMNFIDSESYKVYLHDNRMVFFSEQSETSIAIGLIEK